MTIRYESVLACHKTDVLWPARQQTAAIRRKKVVYCVQDVWWKTFKPTSKAWRTFWEDFVAGMLLPDSYKWAAHRYHVMCCSLFLIGHCRITFPFFFQVCRSFWCMDNILIPKCCSVTITKLKTTHVDDCHGTWGAVRYTARFSIWTRASLWYYSDLRCFHRPYYCCSKMEKSHTS